MTISRLFDRAVTMVVRRWKIAFFGTLAPATIDVVGRTIEHSTALWLGAIIFSTLLSAWFLPLQIQQFAESPSMATNQTRWCLTVDQFRGSLLSLVPCIVGAFFVLLLTAKMLGLAWHVSFLAFAPVALFAATIVPIVLLTVSMAYAFTALSPVSVITGARAAIRQVGAGPLRSWLLGAAVVVPILGGFFLVEIGLRVVGILIESAWLANFGPLLRVPITIFETAVVAVAARDYLDTGYEVAS